MLLGGVALGYFYAVEAAATGAFVLFCGGVVTGRIGATARCGAVLTEAMATTGALFAPLMAATTFTLLLRLLGTDKLIEGWVTALPGGESCRPRPCSAPSSSAPSCSTPSRSSSWPCRS